MYYHTRWYLHNKADIDAISETAPGGAYVLVSVEENIKGDGLWSKVYTYRSAVWPNSTSTPTYVLMGERNPTGFDVGRTDVATGIQNNATAVATFAAISADTGYALDDTRMTEKANGELEFSKTQTLAKGTGDQLVVETNPGYGGRPDTERIWWPPMTAADAITIYNNAITNKATPASLTPAAAAGHKVISIRRIPAGNGLIGIERITSKTNQIDYPADWDNYTVDITWYTIKFRRIWDTTDKEYKDQFRKYTWTDHIRQDSATAASVAYAFANGNGGALKPVKNEVKFFGLGRYWAMYRTCVLSAWAPDPGAMADMGAGV